MGCDIYVWINSIPNEDELYYEIFEITANIQELTTKESDMLDVISNYTFSVKSADGFDTLFTIEIKHAQNPSLIAQILIRIISDQHYPKLVV